MEDFETLGRDLGLAHGLRVQVRSWNGTCCPDSAVQDFTASVVH